MTDEVHGSARAHGAAVPDDTGSIVAAARGCAGIRPIGIRASLKVEMKQAAMALGQARIVNLRSQARRDAVIAVSRARERAGFPRTVLDAPRGRYPARHHRPVAAGAGSGDRTANPRRPAGCGRSVQGWSLGGGRTGPALSRSAEWIGAGEPATGFYDDSLHESTTTRERPGPPAPQLRSGLFLSWGRKGLTMFDEATASLGGDVRDQGLKSPRRAPSAFRSWQGENRAAYQRACDASCTCTPTRAQVLLMNQWTAPRSTNQPGGRGQSPLPLFQLEASSWSKFTSRQTRRLSISFYVGLSEDPDGKNGIVAAYAPGIGGSPMVTASESVLEFLQGSGADAGEDDRDAHQDLPLQPGGLRFRYREA